MTGQSVQTSFRIANGPVAKEFAVTVVLRGDAAVTVATTAGSSSIRIDNADVDLIDVHFSVRSREGEPDHRSKAP